MLDLPAGGNIAQHSGAGRAWARHRHHRWRCGGLCGSAALRNEGWVQVGPAAHRHRSAAPGPTSVRSRAVASPAGRSRLADRDIVASDTAIIYQLWNGFGKDEASNVHIRGRLQSPILLHLSLLSREFSGAVTQATQSIAKRVVGCRGLFATHYHMLSEEHAVDPAVALHHMGCHVQHSADGEPSPQPQTYITLKHFQTLAADLFASPYSSPIRNAIFISNLH